MQVLSSLLRNKLCKMSDSKEQSLRHTLLLSAAVFCFLLF